MASSRHIVNSRTRTNRIGISGGLKRGSHSLAMARKAGSRQEVCSDERRYGVIGRAIRALLCTVMCGNMYLEAATGGSDTKG